MNQPTTSSWFDLIPAPQAERTLQAAMQNVERGLSKMLGHPISLTDPQLLTVPLHQLDSHTGDPEVETVGVYLLINGDLQGQAILLIPLAEAMNLLELLLGSPIIADPLGDLETAALAEVGNLMVAYFLNSMTTQLGRPAPIYPSPPVVMVDMLGAMLNVVVTPIAMRSDQLMIVSCDLRTGPDPATGRDGKTEAGASIPIHFWIVPDPPPPQAAKGAES